MQRQEYYLNCLILAVVYIIVILALSLAHDKEKLQKEVTAMLSFSHPNVMSLIGMCFDGDLPMVLMPYMSNGSVLGYVKQKARELLFEGGENGEDEVHVCNSGDVYIAVSNSLK